jgi:hypothetical protein
MPWNSLNLPPVLQKQWLSLVLVRFNNNYQLKFTEYTELIILHKFGTFVPLCSPASFHFRGCLLSLKILPYPEDKNIAFFSTKNMSKRLILG